MASVSSTNHILPTHSFNATTSSIFSNSDSTRDPCPRPSHITCYHGPHRSTIPAWSPYPRRCCSAPSSSTLGQDISPAPRQQQDGAPPRQWAAICKPLAAPPWGAGPRKTPPRTRSRCRSVTRRLPILTRWSLSSAKGQGDSPSTSTLSSDSASLTFPPPPGGSTHIHRHPPPFLSLRRALLLPPPVFVLSSVLGG
ncbi:unnamed protein product [Gadus morhua 'NCC']